MSNSNKVRFSWWLTHGDGDHYDRYRKTLDDINDINFFDYILDLKFEPRDCKGLIYNEKQEKELISLFNETTFYQKYKEFFSNWKVMYYIIDLLKDWNYLVGDLTNDGNHYAKISDIKRKEIKNK